VPDVARLDGLRVLVTGAASGIGRATAERVAAEGGRVVALDRASAEGCGEAMALRADVTDLAGLEQAAAAVRKELGGLDGVANVAGIGAFTGDVTETAPEEWAATIAVDLTGVYNVSRVAIPLLRAAGGGSVVHVGSQFGLVGCLSSPAYCAAKAGVLGLTRAMALDHAGEGIRVNCVCPGPVDTPMLRASAADESRAGPERARTAGRNLLGRPARPEEVAATIAFLLSADAGAMTGSVVAVDLGWTAG
jgi:NAD(P)-dependent dehydrogenase (short-subunit alcohol dehydrogenase family)